MTEEINTDNEDAVTLFMRAKLAEKEQNYEQAIEDYGKVLSLDPKNVEASRMKILQMVCRQSKYSEAADALRQLFAELERSEPTNAGLFVANARFVIHFKPFLIYI